MLGMREKAAGVGSRDDIQFVGAIDVDELDAGHSTFDAFGVTVDPLLRQPDRHDFALGEDRLGGGAAVGIEPEIAPGVSQHEIGFPIAVEIGAGDARCKSGCASAKIIGHDFSGVINRNLLAVDAVDVPLVIDPGPRNVSRRDIVETSARKRIRTVLGLGQMKEGKGQSWRPEGSTGTSWEKAVLADE